MRITIFTKPDCPRCHHLMSNIAELKYFYDEKDASTLLGPSENWRGNKMHVARAALEFFKGELPVAIISGCGMGYYEACKALGIEPGVKGDKEAIRLALKDSKEKYGVAYCPCVAIDLVPESNRKDHACPCKAWREQRVCQCGLFETEVSS